MSYFLVGALIIVTCSVVLASFLAFRKMVDHIDHQQQRHHEQLTSYQDRFMALDFAEYKNWRSVETAETGGFVVPDYDVPPEEPSGYFEEPSVIARLKGEIP